MGTDPLTEVQQRSGESQREDETVSEYLTRLGDEASIDPDIVNATVEYVTSREFSPTEHGNEDAYHTFLERVRETAPDPDEQTSAGSPDENATLESQTASVGANEQTVTPKTEQATSTTDASVAPATTVDDRHRGSADRRDERLRADAVGLKGGLRGKEPRKLLLRFLVILGAAPAIGWLMGRAWVPGHELYDRGARFVAEFFGLSPVVALQVVGMFGLGLYLALVALFLFDVKKRVQGMLLLLGTVLALGVLSAMGVYLPNIDYTAPVNIAAAIVGVGIGLLVEAQELAAIDVDESTARRPSLPNGDLPEFRNAARTIFGLLTVAIALSLLQAGMAAVINVVDVVAGGLFVVLLFGFIQYESEGRYMTLGPERSGKSMLMLGLCLELTDNADLHPTPNDYLQECLERASNIKAGNERWPMPATPHDEVRGASFEVIAGSYFPRRLELTALDYAGHHLGRVAELFADDTDAPGDEGDRDTVPSEIATWIKETDTLVVLLDTERLVYPEAFHEAGLTDEENVSWGLEYYATILANTNPDDVIVVATKCDILIDQRQIESPGAYDSFAAFKADVTDHLTARPDVRELLQSADETSIQPVYFETITRDGEYLPRLDERGNLVPVGYDHLINEIKRRQ